MHLHQTLAAALALASATLAAPVSEQKRALVTGARRFTVPQSQPKRVGRKLAGPIALARALGKYSNVGLRVSPALEAAASRAADNEDGTVAASPQEYDQAYLEEVTIGGQTLNLDFDTGSSDL